jgi:hypothetical protein
VTLHIWPADATKQPYDIDVKLLFVPDPPKLKPGYYPVG